MGAIVYPPSYEVVYESTGMYGKLDFDVIRHADGYSAVYYMPWHTNDTPGFELGLTSYESLDEALRLVVENAKELWQTYWMALGAKISSALDKKSLIYDDGSGHFHMS